MKLQTSLMTIAALLIAPAALAQTSQTSPAPAAPSTPSPTPTASATPTTSPTATVVTDAEVTQFATAGVAATKINADTTMTTDAKNAKIVEAITAAGLTPERFNAIGQAMQADPALNKRIQDEATKLVPPTPAP